MVESSLSSHLHTERGPQTEGRQEADSQHLKSTEGANIATQDQLLAGDGDFPLHCWFIREGQQELIILAPDDLEIIFVIYEKKFCLIMRGRSPRRDPMVNLSQVSY